MTWKLPKTNNELEQSFGQCGIINVVSGSQSCPASLVQRVSAHCRSGNSNPELLAPKFYRFPIHVGTLCAASYKRINKERTQQRRFRRDPDGYLIELESRFLQLALPR